MNTTIIHIVLLVLLLFQVKNILCLAQKRIENDDHTALLMFKSHLTSENNNSLLFHNWSSNTHFCHWFGVSCSYKQRVVGLELPGMDIGGRISPYIANLSQLLVLDLSENSFSGTLPPELGKLLFLRVLNVRMNHFQGAIPSNLSRCQELRHLYLSDNTFVGSIPEEMGRLSKLVRFRLNNNNLTGKLPTSLGNLSRLWRLYLHENSFHGEIPGEIGQLVSLRMLVFRSNNFTGSVPPSIFNLTEMRVLDLSINRFSGELPNNFLHKLERLFFDSNRFTGLIPGSLSNSSSTLSHLFFTDNDLEGNIPNELGRLQALSWMEFEYNRLSGNIPITIFNISSLQILKARHNYLSGRLPSDLGLWLPRLQELFLSHNLFTGNLPDSICNASHLVYLEAANNSLNGKIPLMLGELVNIKNINFENNLLSDGSQGMDLGFLKSLQKCRKLEYLILIDNPLRGTLPNFIGNLSTVLKVIDAASCEIKGNIPQEMGNLTSLLYLGLGENGLVGNIPSSLAGMQNLERLLLNGNGLEGSLPEQLCSSNRLGLLNIGHNLLSEKIPGCLQNLSQLRLLSLAANKFHSAIPESFWGLTNLEELDLSENLLNGTISPEVGNLKQVYNMDLSSNMFTGNIPSTLGNLQSLISLSMSKNGFQGPLPETLVQLVVLESLDLSFNSFSGPIPKSFQSLRDLTFLNLSFNKLEGEIPHEGAFANLSQQSFMGNPRLCGTQLHVPPCPAPSKQGNTTSYILKITIPIGALLILSSLCFLMWKFSNCCTQKNAANGTDLSPRVGYQIITYNELLRATDHFSETNLIGSGSSSKVYKATLSDGTVSAVKVLNMQREEAFRNFDAECEAMSNARHRNLVKIISTCTNNADFGAMILEYMANGSLDKWLHSDSLFLSFVQRIGIVTDVAMALEYLHHDSILPIIHCDLKPSNVLLDESMTAHVSDFGIAKLLAQDQTVAQTTTLGTIGYIAPECGLDGHLSAYSDVYSFGILVLETFTRKKPTEVMFRQGALNLHQWVAQSFPGEIMNVVDPNLLSDFLTEKTSMEPLVSTINVALLCLKESPEERISMREVVRQLQKINKELVQHLE